MNDYQIIINNINCSQDCNMLQFYQIPREKWFKKRLMHTVIVIQSSQLPAAYWTCISSFWFGGFAFIGVLQRAAKKTVILAPSRKLCCDVPSVKWNWHFACFRSNQLGLGPSLFGSFWHFPTNKKPVIPRQMPQITAVLCILLFFLFLVLSNLSLHSDAHKNYYTGKRPQTVWGE